MTTTGLSIPSTPVNRATARQRSLGDKVELAWIGSIVFYSVLRFAVAWGGFAEHGANPWIFGIIDVGTAIPYAKATAIVVRRVADARWSHLGVPVGVGIVTFFAPYGYLWFAAGEMPDGLRVAMATFVGALLVAAIVGIILKSRKLRREARGDAAGGTTIVATPTEGSELIDVRDSPAELVIDLTQDQPIVVRTPTS